jgi:hypothetical protein
MLAAFQMALCPVGTIVIFFLSFIFRLLSLPGPIWRKVCLAHEAWFNHGTKTDFGLIHVWQFAATPLPKVVSDTQNGPVWTAIIFHSAPV